MRGIQPPEGLIGFWFCCYCCCVACHSLHTSSKVCASPRPRPASPLYLFISALSVSPPPAFRGGGERMRAWYIYVGDGSLQLRSLRSDRAINQFLWRHDCVLLRGRGGEVRKRRRRRRWNKQKRIHDHIQTIAGNINTDQGGGSCWLALLSTEQY